MGLSLVTSVVLVRYLGPQGYGDYTYILTYIGFFAALVWMGLDSIAIREIATQENATDALLSQIFSLKLVLSIVAVILAVAIFPLFGKTSNLWPALALASMTLPVGAFAAPGLIFNARLRMEFKVIADTATALAFLLLTLWVVKIDVGIIGTIAANLASTILGACLLIIFASQFVKIRLAVSLKKWKSLLKEAVPYGLAGFLQLIYSRISVLMLSNLQGSEATGFYAVGYNFFDQYTVIFSFFATSLFPFFSQLANERPRLRQWISRGLVIAGLVSITFILGVFLFGNFIINLLYGAGYDASYTSIKILAFATPFVSCTLILSWTLVAIHQQRKLLRVCIVAFFVNVLLNFILIPRLSFAGSALTTLSTEAVVLFQIVMILKTEFKNPRFPGFTKGVNHGAN